MPFSIWPNLRDIPAPKQDVWFHVWGKLEMGSVSDALTLIKGATAPIDAPFDHAAALRPGGVRLRNIPWGDMPSGLPRVLAAWGLSMAWIAQPAGFEIRGTHLSHGPLGWHLQARANPTRSACDLAISCSLPPRDAFTFASKLLALLPSLGVLDAMSQHVRLRHEAAVMAAHRARTLPELEAAASLVLRKS